MQLLTLMVNYDAARWPAKLDQKLISIPYHLLAEIYLRSEGIAPNMVIGLEIPSALAPLS